MQITCVINERSSIAIHEFLRPYTMERFEPTIFCCNGDDDDHCTLNYTFSTDKMSLEANLFQGT
jgi:hypothetical protein